jgi:ParB/RepB/Spo0J family partition protein
MIQEHDTATAQLPIPGAGPQMRMVEMALIVASKTNPRKTFNEVKLQELAASIKASEVHQPVLLRPLPGSRLAETFDDRAKGAPLPEYELVCGERRFRASRIAEKVEIPAMIRELTDDQVLEIQIVENLQRDDLSELEEAEGYEALMEHSKLNIDDVAAKIGKSTSYVYARLKLRNLGAHGRDALREGKIDASKALLIARIPDAKLQAEACLKMTRENSWSGATMSYRKAQDMVQQEYMLRLDKAKFPITDDSLLPEAGACGNCPKRTGAQPDLYADVKSADVCTDPICYRKKEAAQAAKIVDEARAKGQTVIDSKAATDLLHENSPIYQEPKYKGYRRLDSVDDSPTDKPLRKILEKVMKAEGVVPVMIANPRKPGELVACLPNETVSRLLKIAEGQAQAAKVVSKEVKEVIDAKKAKAEAKAMQKYEAEWRRQLIARCWKAMSEGNDFRYNLEAHRFMTLRILPSLSYGDAAALCDLLGLGKVDPVGTLSAHIKEAIHPDYLGLLMVAQRESDPNDRDSRYTERKANEGMHLVASAAFKDSVQTVINEVQASAAALFLAKPEPLPPAAPEVASTPTPAAHADDSARKGKKHKTPAAPAGDHAGRVSAAEALANIAAAMQEAEGSNPGAAQAAQGNEPGPVAGALGQAGGANEDGAGVNTGATGEVGPGATVRINGTVPKHQAKFIGEVGTVKHVMGDGSCWWVVFTGKLKAQASFHISELDLVAAAPAVDAAPGADEPAADIEPAAAEQTSAAPTLEAGQLVRVKATTSNKKWRGREVTVMSRKTKDAADTDPIWAVRHGTPPKHVDGQFFASDLEPVDQEAAS